MNTIADARLTTSGGGASATTSGAPNLAAGSRPAPQPSAAQASIRSSAVIFYLALALVALVPLTLAKFNIGFETTFPGVPLRALHQALEDIRWGGGLRFWLGISGASMMGLLLLYPLRKLLAKVRWLGRVGGVFHIHIVFGIAGPVLILYHCNLGSGGLNANVALWSMLVVALSGIVGHFIYASVSADFYANKQKARSQLDAIAATFAALNAAPSESQQLISALEAFEAGLLTPRQGVVASISARIRVEQQRRYFMRAAGAVLGECARQLGIPHAQHERLRHALAAHLHAYIKTARHASTRSVREQIWARWRLFHLPVFLVMAVAAGLHIHDVWGLDPPDAASAVTEAAQQAPKLNAASTTTDDAANLVPSPRHVRSGRDAQGAPAVDQQREDARKQADERKRAQERIAAEAKARELQARHLADERRKAEAKRIAEAARIEAETARAKEAEDAQKLASESAVAVAEAKARTTPANGVPIAVQPSDADPIAKLAELKDQEPPQQMSLGAGAALGKSRTLAEQIADFRKRRDAKQFAHAEAETGFALTGKHLNADCADCHKAPLKEQRSSSPRTCVNCHKKDDVHKGRRNDCARCHMPTRWTETKRRDD